MSKYLQAHWWRTLIRVCGCLLIGFLLQGRVSLADVRGEPSVQLTVIESSQQAIVLELTVHDFSVENVEYGGEQFQRVNIVGAEQTIVPGAPQVPSRGALLGIPTPVGVAVQVLETDFETRTGYKLYPAPQFTLSDDATGSDGLSVLAASMLSETFVLDATRYATDAFYPTSPADPGEVGYLRDQAVAQLLFHPVQYNPALGQVRIYHRIRVQVTWDGVAPAATTEVREASPVYEDLLRHTLLNYNTLARPPVGTAGASAVANAPTQGTSSSATPSLKIGINADGLYILTYADLLNAGLDPGAIDPHTLKLHHRDTEVAIYVYGEEDGVFDSTDYLLFYGTAIRDAYTTLNIYWLSAGGDAGRRMTTRDGAPAAYAAMAFPFEIFLPLITAQRDTPPGPVTVPSHFPATLHEEEDTVYWQTMPGTGEDRWFWGKRLSPNTKGMPVSRTYPLVLHNLSVDATATLRVRLKGYTGLAHRTRIYINDYALDDQTWNGQIQFTHQVDLPQSLLKDGENAVLVETVDTGAVVDQILVNWFELDYWNRYIAEDDQLLFSTPAPGAYRFEIGGFASADLHLFDVTDTTNPVQITNAAVVSEGRQYKVKFEDNVWTTNRYLALTAAHYKSPASVVLDQPSSWKSTDNGADYIIITHGDFYASALTLAEHRRAAGLRVVTVNVDDIYDEFNAGIFNPKAIRDFLTYAYQHWQAPAPTYVLLIGDANQDYKDNLKNGTLNYVPSKNIESSLFGEVSSDSWFASVSGDDSLPDLLIGRLVAQSEQEAADMIEKIIRYEQAPPDATWNKNILLVADDDETRFRTISEELAARLPYYYAVNRIYVDGYPPGDPNADIISHINSGSILVNYTGHGEYYGWGRWDGNTKPILENEDVDQLDNANKLPVITVANCLNGFFGGPKDKPALAEVLQRRKNGGGLAIWAPTSLEYSTGHSILMRKFYDAIFVDDQDTLGAATTAAKLATFAQNNFWQELIETYVLFGDPATKLGIETNYPYILKTSPADGADGVLLDQHVQIVFNKSMDPNTVAIGEDTVAGIEFTPSWNDNFTMVDFSPSGFAPRKTYEISLSGYDRQRNALGAGIVPNPWSFTITQDDIAPTGIIRIQGGDPSGVIATAILTISFTEPMRTESVTYTITPTVRGTLNWDDDGQQAEFQHERFVEGQKYTFAVLSAQDIAGNGLTKPLQLSFTAEPTFFVYLPYISTNGSRQ